MKVEQRRLLTVGACVAFGAITAFSQAPGPGGSVPAAREYTIIHNEISGSQAPPSAGEAVLEAQRADGSRVRTAVTMKGDEAVPSTLRDIALLPEGLQVRVDDALKAKTTMHMRGLPARPAAADPQCGISRLAPQTKPSPLGQETILGFAVVGIQTEMQGPDESYVTKEWRAPELDCAVLRMDETRRNSKGEAIGEFHTEAVKVVSGPPTPGLFEIPAGYAEKSPSQMYAAHSARPLSPGMRKTLELQDRKYFDSQQPAHQ